MDSRNDAPVMYALSKSQREQFILAAGADVGANVNLGGMLFWFDAGCSDTVIERAVNLILEHEQALRLRLAIHGGEPLQYETEYAYTAVPAERTSLSRQEIVEQAMRAVNSVSFAFNQCLYDFRIIRSDSEVALRACFHHAIMDGRSLAIFGARLYEYVQSLREGAAIRWETHRFTDSLEAEAVLLQSDRCRANRLYWREMIRDWTSLCAMNPQAAMSANSQGRQLALEPDREYGRRINAHCERCGITPAYLFQAALAVYLLHVNPGASHADMGQTIAARRNAREKESLGNFALELFLRIPVHDDDTLAVVRQSVKEANFQTLSRSLCTYEDIVAMKRESMPGVVAMRDLMFTYIPPSGSAFHPLDVDLLVNESPETSVEFFVIHMEDKDLFSIVFDYRTDVFTEAGADAAFDSIMSLVDMLVNDVAITVKEARKTMSDKQNETARDEMAEKVIAILAKYSTVPDIRPDSRLQADLGIDSFDLVNAAIDAREALDFTFREKTLPAFATVDDLIEYVRSLMR